MTAYPTALFVGRWGFKLVLQFQQGLGMQYWIIPTEVVSTIASDTLFQEWLLS